MGKLIDVLYGIFKVGSLIANVIKKAKANKRKKQDEKEQADLEHILGSTTNDK